MLVLVAGVIVLSGMLVRLLGLRASGLLRELSGLATHDQLTGLLNRRGVRTSSIGSWSAPGGPGGPSAWWGPRRLQEPQQQAVAPGRGHRAGACRLDH